MLRGGRFLVFAAAKLGAELLEADILQAVMHRIVDAAKKVVQRGVDALAYGAVLTGLVWRITENMIFLDGRKNIREQDLRYRAGEAGTAILAFLAFYQAGHAERTQLFAHQGRVRIERAGEVLRRGPFLFAGGEEGKDVH